MEDFERKNEIDESRIIDTLTASETQKNQKRMLRNKIATYLAIAGISAGSVIAGAHAKINQVKEDARIELEATEEILFGALKKNAARIKNLENQIEAEKNASETKTVYRYKRYIKERNNKRVYAGIITSDHFLNDTEYEQYIYDGVEVVKTSEKDKTNNEETINENTSETNDNDIVTLCKYQTYVKEGTDSEWTFSGVRYSTMPLKSTENVRYLYEGAEFVNKNDLKTLKNYEEAIKTAGEKNSDDIYTIYVYQTYIKEGPDSEWVLQDGLEYSTFPLRNTENKKHVYIGSAYDYKQPQVFKRLTTVTQYVKEDSTGEYVVTGYMTPYGASLVKDGETYYAAMDYSATGFGIMVYQKEIRKNENSPWVATGEFAVADIPVGDPNKMLVNSGFMLGNTTARYQLLTKKDGEWYESGFYEIGYDGNSRDKSNVRYVTYDCCGYGYSHDTLETYQKSSVVHNETEEEYLNSIEHERIK